jgi:hypothetical protein
MKERKIGSRVLRFAVSGALLVLPLGGCGEDDDDVHVNEPAPEPVHVNEPAQPTPSTPPPPPGPQVPDEQANPPSEQHE